MTNEMLTIYGILVVGWFILFPLGVFSRIAAKFMD